MNARFRRGLAVAAVLAAGSIALSGCTLLGAEDNRSAQPTPTGSASAAATPSASRAGTSKGPARAGLPDVCQLLSKTEVSTLAGGRAVAQVDPDGAAAGAATRHCQWQLNGARLAVFLSPTTAAEFTQARSAGQAVDGVGDDAYTDSGHLFVRHGSTQIDVYATISGNEPAGERMAKATALAVIERL